MIPLLFGGAVCIRMSRRLIRWESWLRSPSNTEAIATAIYKFFCDAVDNSEILTICCSFRTPLQCNNKFPFISPHAMLYSPILARLSEFERIALAQHSDVKSFQFPNSRLRLKI